ncbi:MAG: transcriptional activator domain protein [Actinobacteria bacterium]|nr:transcriptional activator domain protein [Actinomycetota bacterium]
MARPRLVAELSRLIADHRVVDITATAGSGKTTTVASATTSLDAPIAWLTLDDTDAAAGRLLTYLEATVRRAIPAIGSPAGQALGRGLTQAEAASFLAQRIGDRRMIVVIDEVERLVHSPDARAVLSSLIRYTGPDVRFVLIGRRRVHFDALSRIGLDEVGRLDEQVLAFTTEEAEAALRLHGGESVDANSVVVSVGGWVAGVLFEAWRSRDHVAGSGGERDPLAGYLAVQILEQLDAAERDFLVITSVLDEVDREAAEALGLANAGEMLGRLREAHLPASWRDDGTVMRCHPRFREHLRNLLEEREPEKVAAIRLRHAELLAKAGRHEEAIEELFALDRPAAAVELADRAFDVVISRRDLKLAERWLARFEEAGVGAHPVVLAAQLSIATTVEEFGRGVEAADRMRRLAAEGTADELDPDQKALAAWCYWHVGRLDDARALLAETPETGLGEPIRYLFSLVDDEPPTRLPAVTGGPLDVLVLRIAYVRGRLREVRDAPASVWTPVATERAAALRALGELRLTQELLESPATHLSNLRFEGTLATELMIDIGDEEGARRALARGRDRVSRSGSFVFQIVLRLLEAKIELKLSRDPTTALAILEDAAAIGPLREYGYLAEQFDLWQGFARLQQGRDAEAARSLAAAYDRMRAADRILELPAAAVYLSEARWRLGDEAGADEAATHGLQAADRLGSRHLLVGALRDVPGVLARQMDAVAESDGPWHELSRSVAGLVHPRAQASARVLLQDFGPPYLVVDGEQCRVRLNKSYALLGYLIEAGGRARRKDLLTNLFDGHAGDSAGAYLRQVVHGLRRLLPEDLRLTSDGEWLQLEQPEAFAAASRQVLAEVDHAAMLTGGERIAATERALAGYERGAYLDGLEGTWIDERRAWLEAQRTDAQSAMAVAAFEESRFDLAERALREVTARDPYLERPWRLLMRVAAARGSEVALLAAFRGCERAMNEAGLEPSAETRRLLDALRR